MALKVSAQIVWAGDIADAPGGLAEKLGAISASGANLEFVNTTNPASRPFSTHRFMSLRINYRATAPDTITALFNVKTHLEKVFSDHRLKALVELRTSQINGCAYCVDLHCKDARKAGEARPDDPDPVGPADPGAIRAISRST